MKFRVFVLFLLLGCRVWAQDPSANDMVSVTFKCDPKNTQVYVMNEKQELDFLGSADKPIPFNKRKYDHFVFRSPGYDDFSAVIESKNFNNDVYPSDGVIELHATLLTKAKRFLIWFGWLLLIPIFGVSKYRGLKAQKSEAEERVTMLEELQAEAMLSKDTVLGQRLGSYLLTAFLGKGGMAAVYRGTDGPAPKTGNAVAVKVLSALDDEQAVERFRREVQICQKLIHPNIVALHDWGEENGLIFLALELVEGGCLEDWMEKGLNLNQSLRIFDEILAGMEFAHSQGVTHRDLKPDNILMTTAGKPKVADFGLAKSLSIKTVTVTGAVMGTPAYMSPEQIQGQDPSPSMDQYSLGVLGFQLFSGRLPFEAQDMMVVITKHLIEDAPSLLSVNPELPGPLNEIIARMLCKDPADRFEDLAAVRRALAPLLS